MKKVLFLARQLLIGVILLQLLNLSVCSDAYMGYCTETSRDPTETIVEWVVEWKKGNQDRFTYDNSINLKGINKSFSWHVDVQHGFLSPLPVQPPVLFITSETRNHLPLDAFIDIISPPPEC